MTGFHRNMKSTSSILLNPHRSICCQILAWTIIGSLASCSFSASGRRESPAPATRPLAAPTEQELTPAQDYAGEILAYFLQIVVGQIGPEEKRHAWRSTGANVALDFQSISQVMSRPASRKSDLMVFDFDLLALVEILTHYNPRFNLFKGQAIFNSVYPSSELIAIRLLIQNKLNRGEKISFTALHSQEALLQPDAKSPTAENLAAINLSAVEFQLVKDVFASDPLFFQYYKHPFIVDAMVRIGFYRADPLTAEISRRASYRHFGVRSDRRSSRGQSVDIVVLPSLTQKFEFGGNYAKPYIYGFKPSASYLQAAETLRREILDRSADLLIAELKNNGKASAINEQSWMALWENVYVPLIRFELFERRPLTIYPENADRLVKEICPAADLVIILLGDGMERVIDGSLPADDFSLTGRLYFNMDDIRYYKENDKIDEMSRRIVKRLLTSPISTGEPAAPAPVDPANRSQTAKMENPLCSASMCW